jgi:hypothetical protein
MPLSDREQQILSQIEAHFREEDPKFARTVGTVTVTSEARRRIRLSVAAFVVGFVLLLATIPVGELWPGLVGFGIMLSAVVYGGQQLKRLGADQTGDLGGQLKGGFHRYLHDRRDRDAQDDS